MLGVVLGVELLARWGIANPLFFRELSDDEFGLKHFFRRHAAFFYPQVHRQPALFESTTGASGSTQDVY